MTNSGLPVGGNLLDIQRRPKMDESFTKRGKMDESFTNGPKWMSHSQTSREVDESSANGLNMDGIGAGTPQARKGFSKTPDICSPPVRSEIVVLSKECPIPTQSIAGSAAPYFGGRTVRIHEEPRRGTLTQGCFRKGFHNAHVAPLGMSRGKSVDYARLP